MSTPLNETINRLLAELLALASDPIVCKQSKQADFQVRLMQTAEAINQYAINARDVIDRQDAIIL